MKIYTKKGDKGETSLLYGDQVSKDNIAPEAHGSVDELVAALGLIRCEEKLPIERVKLSTEQLLPSPPHIPQESTVASPPQFPAQSSTLPAQSHAPSAIPSPLHTPHSSYSPTQSSTSSHTPSPSISAHSST